MDKSAGMQQAMPQPDVRTIAIVGRVAAERQHSRLGGFPDGE